VDLNPASNVLPLMGSKEGTMHISMALLTPGDHVLLPNPGYPTYLSGRRLVGAEPLFYSLSTDAYWLQDMQAMEEQDLTKVKLMCINYPNMPTGAVATEAFFIKLVAFAKKHHILIVNDNPYGFILNDSPKSILSIPEAKYVCMELNSLSKTFNMSGWRVGMVLGNPDYINHVLKIKSNMDSGMLYGIQKGAIEALNCSELWYKNLNNTYEERRKLIWQLAD